MLQTKPCAAGGQKSEKNCSRMGVFFFFIYFYREREGDGSFCRSISGEASPTDPTPPSLLCRPASCPLTDHGRCDGLIRLVSSLLISCYTTPPACQLLQRELLLLSLSLFLPSLVSGVVIRDLNSWSAWWWWWRHSRSQVLLLFHELHFAAKVIEKAAEIFSNHSDLHGERRQISRVCC